MKIALIIYGVMVGLGALGVTFYCIRGTIIKHTYNYVTDNAPSFKIKMLARLQLLLICFIPIYNALQILTVFLPEEHICDKLEEMGWYIKEDD